MTRPCHRVSLLRDNAIVCDDYRRVCYHFARMEPFFTTTEDGPHTLVQFQTESLMSTPDLERIGQSLNRLVDEEKRQSVLLDFSKVRYLSSQAIGMIISLHKKLSQSRGSLELLGVNTQLLQLLKITKLDRLLTIRS